jgi:hypothetical protein
MKIDMHCHVLGDGKDINNINNDVFFNNNDNPLGSFDAKKLFVRYIVTSLIKDFLKKEGGEIVNGEISTDDYFDLIKTLLITSEEIDAIVLLAMDGIYNNKGSHELMVRETELLVSNRYLYRKIYEINEELQNSADERIRNKKFLFGASVSPNRLDWESELDYVCNQTDAVLLKWVPSAMHIEVWDQNHKEFYEMLKYYNLPLLCHVGPEYAFIEGVSQSSLDNYKYLEVPLSYGVKVIAAHCASPVFPTDKSDLDGFIEFIKMSNSGDTIKLWADTSALSITTRLLILYQIVNSFKPEWLVNGSDFPIPISGTEHLPLITYDMSIDEYMKIINTKNPFDLDVRIKRAHGFSDTILSNAENLLRMQLV